VSDRFNRLPSHAGFCEPSKLPKGPRGFNLCRQCNEECPGKRRTFCSSACVDAWKERTDPAFQRRKVWERDGGICQQCRLDVGALEDRLKKIAEALGARMGWGSPMARKLNALYRARRVQRLLARFGGDRAFHDHRPALTRSLWEMDHIVPVVEGGGSCGLDNLRVLCRPCHVAETRELARRRAEQRRAARP